MKAIRWNESIHGLWEPYWGSLRLGGKDCLPHYPLVIWDDIAMDHGHRNIYMYGKVLGWAITHLQTDIQELHFSVAKLYNKVYIQPTERHIMIMNVLNNTPRFLVFCALLFWVSGFPNIESPLSIRKFNRQWVQTFSLQLFWNVKVEVLKLQLLQITE